MPAIGPFADFSFQLRTPGRTVSTTLNIGELLNLVGLSAGVVLYAMLLVMVVLCQPRSGCASSPIRLSLSWYRWRRSHAVNPDRGEHCGRLHWQRSPCLHYI